MQCNTNYTSSIDNYKYINLNVLKLIEVWYDLILGLSDHTKGSVTVLGSIALGARVIEKHFTDTKKDGPDHPFYGSKNGEKWLTGLLELALGGTLKKVEENEKETVVLQRRSIRVIRDLKSDEILSIDDIEFQRPSPKDSISINEYKSIIGKKVNKPISKGDCIRKENIRW